MEALDQAKKLYVKCHDHEDSLSEEDRAQLTSDIQRFITIAIKEITSKNLFSNNWMLTILKRALEVCTKENSDVMPVSRAFSSLERYMLNLVEQPWKPEYKKLKMYGGFYKTRIKSVLPEPETIFQKAGYTVSGGNHIMVLKGPINKNNLLLLAFDCRIAAVECKTIAEHYSKLKAVGMNLSDAVSTILHEAMARDVYLPRGHVTSVKRVPPSKAKISYECAYVTDMEDPIDQMENIRHNTARYLPRADFVTGVETVNPPLLNTNKMYGALPYMDGNSEENIPELPQGTSDEHMRESLKLFNRHEHPKLANSKSAPVSREVKSDDWKLCQQVKESARVSVPTNTEAYTCNRGQPGGQIMSGASNPLSINTYPPSVVKSKSGPATAITDASIDEGIQVDMGSSRFTQLSSGQSSLYQQPSVSNNSLNNNKHVSGHPGGYYAQVVNSPARSNHVLPSPLYQDSAIARHHITHPPQDVELNNSVVPPPVPSRALKPSPYQKTSGSVDVGETIYRPPAMKGLSFLQPNIDGPSQSEVVRTQSDLPKLLPCAPKRSITEPIMRRPGKSNSLKYGDEKSEAAVRVANSRTVRSMDMTLSPWQCNTCTNLNLASATVCCLCAHSRHGPHLEQREFGATKIACPYCTLENDPSRRSCECCGKELLNRYTSYV